MKKYVNQYEFVDEMSKKDNGFSFEGAIALFDYLEEFEDETGEEIEFDPIELRSYYEEYPSATEAAEAHGWSDENKESALEYLEDRAVVIEFKGGVIIGPLDER